MDSRLSALKAADPARLAQLRLEHGGAFFVLDVNQFRDDSRRFTAVLRDRYPRSRLGYSVKTNNLPDMLEAARDEGLLAEVVSRTELDLALLAGFAGSDIIFNGPVKDHAAITRALAMGAQVNVDSLEELHRLGGAEDTAIGIRCFLGDDLTPQSRFGIDLAVPGNTLALRAAVARGVRINAVHCHFPGDRSPGQYAARVRRLAEIIGDHLDAAAIEMVDVGGGMAGPMSAKLRSRVGQPAWDYCDYANAIGDEAARWFGIDGPLLVLEPGTAIVAHVGWYVAGVVSRKRIGTREIAVLDGTSLDLNPFRTGFQLPAHLVPAAAGSARRTETRVEFVGATCMEDDVIDTSLTGMPEVGDHVLVENCGAYSMSLSSNFITGVPAVLAMGTDGAIGACIRPAGDAAAVFHAQGGRRG